MEAAWFLYVPIDFLIVSSKAAWFPYCPSEGRSVCALSFRRWVCNRSGPAYLNFLWYTFCEMPCFAKLARSDDAAAERFMGGARRRHRLAPKTARQTRTGTDHMPNVANSQSHIHLNVEMGTPMNSGSVPHASTSRSCFALLSTNRVGLRSCQHQTPQT